MPTTRSSTPPLYERMLKSHNERVPLAAELADIAKRGPGSRCPDATQALSLDILRRATKRRVTLAEVFSHLSNNEAGWDDYLKNFGIAVQRWAMLPGEPLTIGIDLTENSYAGSIFKKAKVEHWRSAIAQDSYSLEIHEPIGNIYPKAWARFRLPTKPE